jgi:hypothetical protein
MLRTVAIEASGSTCSVAMWPALPQQRQCGRETDDAAADDNRRAGMRITDWHAEQYTVYDLSINGGNA